MKKCILFLLFFGTAFAQNNPCCCFQPTEKLFFVEGLYFKAATSDFDYALVDSNVFEKNEDDQFFGPCGTEKGCCPDYEWGFRIGAQTSIGCEKGDARLVYSRLCSDSKECTKVKCNDGLWLTSGLGALQGNVDILVSTDGITAFAKNCYQTEWNAVDAEFGYKARKRGCLSLRANAGLHWTNICVDRKLFYQGNVYENGTSDRNYCANFCTNIEAWGIGPRFGGEASYDLGCCLSLEARAGWAILAGGTHRTVKGKAVERSAQTHELFEEGKMRVHTPDRCLVFPEFDAALAVNFHAFHNCCVDATIGLGWEFRTYLNAIKQPYYTSNDREGLHAIDSDSYSLQGLTIRGTLKF